MSLLINLQIMLSVNWLVIVIIYGFHIFNTLLGYLASEMQTFHTSGVLFLAYVLHIWYLYYMYLYIYIYTHKHTHTHKYKYSMLFECLFLR